jgi:hypothetical protein
MSLEDGRRTESKKQKAESRKRKQKAKAESESRKRKQKAKAESESRKRKQKAKAESESRKQIPHRKFWRARSATVPARIAGPGSLRQNTQDRRDDKLPRAGARYARYRSRAALKTAALR